MIRACAFLVAITAATLMASAPAPAGGAQKWFEKAVKKVEGSFAPAEAKPGQTVTFTLTVELNDGYYTYPLAQVDPQADGMTNSIKFPDPGAVIFVGKAEGSPKYSKKAEPALGIKELRYYPGTATYTRKAVVSPKAAPGGATVKLAEFSLNVCDKDNCFPPKAVPVSAALKVLAGPAVEVEAAYADEVKKALAGK
jgi:hypothetical protein